MPSLPATPTAPAAPRLAPSAPSVAAPRVGPLGPVAATAGSPFAGIQEAATAIRKQKEKEARRKRRRSMLTTFAVLLVIGGAVAGGVWLVRSANSTAKPVIVDEPMPISTDAFRFVMPEKPEHVSGSVPLGNGVSRPSNAWLIDRPETSIGVMAVDFGQPLTPEAMTAGLDGMIKSYEEGFDARLISSDAMTEGTTEIRRGVMDSAEGRIFFEMRSTGTWMVVLFGLGHERTPPDEYISMLDSFEFLPAVAPAPVPAPAPAP